MSTVTFVAPPPGLDPLTRFSLASIDGADGLYALRSLEREDSRLFLLDPYHYIPGYAPEFTDQQCAQLELTRPEDAAVFVVATHRDGRTTANLLAPIVVNTTSDRCAQFILEGQDWPLQAELKP